METRLGPVPRFPLEHRCALEEGEYRLRRVGDAVEDAVLRARVTETDRLFELLEERVEVSPDIRDHDGLAMDPELLPRDHFEELLERPEPPRKRHEGIAEVEHRLLAVVHGLDDPKLRQARVGGFATNESPGDHADDLPAGSEDFIGEHPHEAERGAAVDESNSSPGDLAAERTDLTLHGWIPGRARAAVDDDPVQFHDRDLIRRAGCRAFRAGPRSRTAGSLREATREPRARGRSARGRETHRREVRGRRANQPRRLLRRPRRSRRRLRGWSLRS